MLPATFGLARGACRLQELLERPLLERSDSTKDEPEQEAALYNRKTLVWLRTDAEIDPSGETCRQDIDTRTDRLKSFICC